MSFVKKYSLKMSHASVTLRSRWILKTIFFLAKFLTSVGQPLLVQQPGCQGGIRRRAPGSQIRRGTFTGRRGRGIPVPSRAGGHFGHGYNASQV